MSPARSEVFVVTRIAPALAIANCSTIHSGTLVAHSTTRSPRPTPSAIRPRAMVRASCSSAAKGGAVSRLGGGEGGAGPPAVAQRLAIRQPRGQPRQQIADGDVAIRRL